MYAGFYEEGDNCPKCHKSQLSYGHVENCSCHISPPCSKCVNNPLTCDSCGYVVEQENYHDIQVVPGLISRHFKPRKLDNSKIDYRTKEHTHFSMIREGVYPEGTTREEVECVVKGTFGGRFKSFGKGKFVYIAYTD